jgi:hypothetical protein
MAIRTAPWAAIAALLLLLAAAPARAHLVNENLLVGLPPGYKVGWQDRKPNLQMSEMVPAGETVESWTEMVTVQIFFGMKSTPDQFRDRLGGLWTSACPGGRVHPVDAGPDNGYASLIWVLSCERNPKTGKPEITWVKAVQGNDSFYVVQKAFRFMPSQEQATRWLKYLTDVKVCDSRLPDRRCPQTK